MDKGRKLPRLSLGFDSSFISGFNIEMLNNFGIEPVLIIHSYICFNTVEVILFQPFLSISLDTPEKPVALPFFKFLIIFSSTSSLILISSSFGLFFLYSSNNFLSSSSHLFCHVQDQENCLS